MFNLGDEQWLFGLDANAGGLLIKLMEQAEDIPPEANETGDFKVFVFRPVDGQLPVLLGTIAVSHNRDTATNQFYTIVGQVAVGMMYFSEWFHFLPYPYICI